MNSRRHARKRRYRTESWGETGSGGGKAGGSSHSSRVRRTRRKVVRPFAETHLPNFLGKFTLKSGGNVLNLRGKLRRMALIPEFKERSIMRNGTA